MDTPLLSRVAHLGMSGVLRLLFAVLFVTLEGALRFVFWFVPAPVLQALERLRINGLRIVPSVSLLRGSDEDDPTCDMTSSQLIRHYGFKAEEHLVLTSDGYYLTLHRVLPNNNNSSNSERGGEPPERLNGGGGGGGGGVALAASPRPPVLLQHGLMQNSEAWLVGERALAYELVRSGFDVWLGNNRGNSYSCKHTVLSPGSQAFWNFCLDDMALKDLPANLEYITNLTQTAKVHYVGFSQGTAQMFAGLSSSPALAAKVASFVALAPAARARGFAPGLLKTFVSLAPDALFMLLGTKAVVPSTLFWRGVLSRATFAAFIEACVAFLFEWRTEQLGERSVRQALFAHIYSPSSVKTVVHWLQMVTARRFQMYDDGGPASRGGGGSVGYRAAVPFEYSVSSITCPLAVFYGKNDQLPDNEWLLDNVPPGTTIHGQEGYEHLDLMWAATAPDLIFPRVVSFLTHHSEGSVKAGRTMSLGSEVSSLLRKGSRGVMTID